MHERKKLGFREEDQKKKWKEHIKVINEEDVWDQVMKADKVEGPIQMVTL